MLDLSPTEFYLAVPNVPALGLKRQSTSLFELWEKYVDASLSLQDYSLFLQIEEGSVRGFAKIGVALGVLYAGIGNYGDFVSGLKTIGEQVEAASEFLAENAQKVFHCPNDKTKVRRRGGAIGSLRALFNKVQRGELTPEEATARAEALIGEEGNGTPEFLDGLEKALRECPHYHEQQMLQFPEDSGVYDLPGAPKKSKPPYSAPPYGPSLQFRIEVWRESKKKRKHTRVVRL
jgi:hypothetical protein